MASILSAGTTSNTALNLSGDTSGVLQLATNGTTTALTIDTSQNTTFVGSATATRFVPSGSTVPTNGLYLPTTNTIGLATNSSERVRIDSSGNVGIGTTSPSTPLQVNGTITATSVNTNNTFGFKNRIINGAMVIDQRNAGASITGNDGVFPVDRFTILASQSSKLTVQQSTVAPTGFSNSLLATSSSAYSVLSTDQFTIQQRIEGFNTSDLMWGTASASTVTLSFWVRSSLTGTFGGALTNNAYNRTYPFSYTISAANTWEQKSITVAGDTTGTWVGATNGVGLRVSWSLGAGSSQSGTAGAWAASGAIAATGQVNLVGTNGATFYVAGVQLEKGSTATSFDYRPYGTELALCQRYTYRHSAEGNVDSYAPLGLGRYYGTNDAQLYVPFKVTMRTSPSSVTQVGNIFVNSTSLGGAAITLALNETSSSGATLTGTTTTGTTAGNATTFYADNTSNAALIFNAEL